MAYGVELMGRARHDSLDAITATTRMLKREPLYREPVRELLRQHRSLGFVGFENLALRLMPDVLSPVEQVGMAAAIIWGTTSHYRSVRVPEREALWAATDRLWPVSPVQAANDNGDATGEAGIPPVAPAPAANSGSGNGSNGFELEADNDDDEPSTPRFG